MVASTKSSTSVGFQSQSARISDDTVTSRSPQGSSLSLTLNLFSLILLSSLFQYSDIRQNQSQLKNSYTYVYHSLSLTCSRLEPELKTLCINYLLN